jgi:hypothetical protein
MPGGINQGLFGQRSPRIWRRALLRDDGALNQLYHEWSDLSVPQTACCFCPDYAEVWFTEQSFKNELGLRKNGYVMKMKAAVSMIAVRPSSSYIARI